MGPSNYGEYILRRLSTWLHRPGKPNCVQEVPELGAALGTTIGEVRRDNQDRGLIARFSGSDAADPFVAAILSDGMGGMVDGAQCAEIAVAHFVVSLLDPQNSQTGELAARLRTAVQKANEAIFRTYRGRGGATIASVVHTPGELTGVTAGDSRHYGVYKEHSPKQLSIDHTVAAEVGKAKGVEASQLRLGHLSAGLAQFVGMGPGLEARTYELSTTSIIGYYLSSDSAHAAGSPIFESLLSYAASSVVAVTRVLQVSRWIGGRDNASIVFLPGPAVPVTRFTGDQQCGVLEVWDFSSKLELLFGIASQLPPTLRQPTTAPIQQRTVLSDDLPQPGQEPHAPEKRKRRSRRGEKRMEHPQRPASRPILQIEIEEPDNESTVTDSARATVAESSDPHVKKPEADMSEGADGVKRNGSV